MDGSAADGEHPSFSSLLHAVVIRRLHRAGGTCPDRTSAKKGGQEGQRQKVGQEVRQEIREEGRQEGGTAVFRQEGCQEVSEEVGQEERPAGSQAREIRPEGFGQIRIPAASEKGRAALAVDQLLESSRAMAAAQLINAM